MTALRIFKSDKPMRRLERVVLEPMSEDDEQFWRLLRQQKPELYQRKK